jgi:hypothetical protein
MRVPHGLCSSRNRQTRGVGGLSMKCLLLSASVKLLITKAAPKVIAVHGITAFQSLAGSRLIQYYYLSLEW